MSEEQKKTLYHSELVKLGPVQVTVKSDVLESKKKAGTYYVILEIAGQTRYYNPENEACQVFFDGAKDQDITIKATGSRGDAAFELLEGHVGDSTEPPQESPTPQRAAPVRPPAPAKVPPRAGPPKPEQGAPAAIDPMLDAKQFVARNASLAKVTLKAFMKLNEEFAAVYGFEMPAEMYGPIINSLFFGASAHGLPHKLPLDIDLSTLDRRAK